MMAENIEMAGGLSCGWIGQDTEVLHANCDLTPKETLLECEQRNVRNVGILDLSGIGSAHCNGSNAMRAGMKWHR